MTVRRRPTGVTILALLALLIAVLSVVGNIALMNLAGLATRVGISSILGIVVSVLYLALALGAWTLQPWARWLGIALGALGIVAAGIAYMSAPGELIVAIATVAINAVVIYYLSTPTVKAAFGQG